MPSSVRLNRTSSAATANFSYLWTSRGRALTACARHKNLPALLPKICVLLLLNNSIQEIQILEEYGSAVSMKIITVRSTENKSLYIFISVDLSLQSP